MHRKRLFSLGALLPAMICPWAGCSGGSSSQPPQLQPASTSTALATSSGLLIYGDDNNFVRLDLFNDNDTRQVEFIKAQSPQASGYPTWGATNVGAASINAQVSVWLRIARRNVNGAEHYTAYSSNDGTTWIQGGTWVHQLGSNERICLYAGNRTGYTGTFHYVHVSTVQ